jgi:hypothetical protein
MRKSHICIRKFYDVYKLLLEIVDFEKRNIQGRAIHLYNHTLPTHWTNSVVFYIFFYVHFPFSSTFYSGSIIFIVIIVHIFSYFSIIYAKYSERKAMTMGCKIHIKFIAEHIETIFHTDLRLRDKHLQFRWECDWVEKQ